MTGYVATIGMFDGVHRGHQFVLRQVAACARERGLRPMVITFDHSLRREAVLTPLDEKLQLLKNSGMDRVEVLPFTEQLRQQTARTFMEQVLKEQLHVSVLMTGYDNRFGHDRVEGFDDYVRYGRELGIDVVGLPAAPLEDAGAVSSSVVRQLLTEGRVREAAVCLGRPYTVAGRVEHGEHVGTQLGFPTANLVPACAAQLVPAPGVYAVKVRLEHSLEQKHAMMNIGHRPTFGGQRTTLEVHILRLHDDLYGQQLQVSFFGRLREERRFASADALRLQLHEDAQLAERMLNQNSDLMI